MITFIAAGVYESAVVSDTIDCNDHMAAEGVKGERYLARQLMSMTKEHNPDKDVIDMLVFDGALNVQKAADIINKHYPKCRLSQRACT